MASRPRLNRYRQVDFTHPACLPAMTVSLQFEFGETPAKGLFLKVWHALAKAVGRRPWRRRFGGSTVRQPRQHGQALRSTGD